MQIVGKTNLSEFAVAPSGINDFFGTPASPLSNKNKFIPGGSSSGSAVAIANGLADVAFGTDTAGSIRVPAACCGIVGLKTTFGLVSLNGVFPVDPIHLDTVGPMGKNVERVVQGMDLLQNGFAARYRAAITARPSGKKIRVGRLYLSGTDPEIDNAVDGALVRAQFRVVPLDQAFQEKWDQAPPSIHTVSWFEGQILNLQNTVPVNLAGNPALAIPIPLKNRDLPATGLQLVGPRLSEADLLNAGRLIEASSLM